MTAEIKKLMETDRLVKGTKLTLKNLKLGKLEKIFVTSNCPAEVKEDIKHFSDLAKVKVVQLDITNEELGIVCKRPHLISVLGVLKE
ncbi:ribosomal L7Ae/L30e/S12e/Gadd45 family protein [Candidatus Woesearchaeota archaeon]|jgi:large subunit ribosomal protein L30e|nr:ribosomal L7Ae/L30e/S12e/Gadd45 family protein [Candidatus Woesearchaeota archaeon]